ncbi:hypothetical protein ACFXKX_35650 [Streptomyces scopuliridis]|uniref:hypothetical protein n=1 Tax=Streptomyces scopuliridis TaxID=452529 RepID=UPI0036BE955C
MRTVPGACEARTAFLTRGVDVVTARTTVRTLVPAAAVALVLAGPTAARAAPTPSPSPTGNCNLLHGPLKDYCEDGAGSPPSLLPGGDDAPTSLDPLQALSDGFAKAAAWTVDQLSNAVNATAEVDFTNGSFVKTYALVFAAATFLTILLWLWAVAKRAVRGVPLTTALGEALGLLWLTVIASAFTPLVLYVVVQAVDGVTAAIAGGGGDGSAFFQSFSDALRADSGEGGGGPIAKIVLSLVSIIAAGVVWLELVIRAALLYVGAALGTVVYAGLVDKDLWGRVKKWAGIMSAIILVKPIIVIVLRLASALSGGDPKDSTGSVISGLAIIAISIIASALLFRMIPGMGDEIVAARRDSYDSASRQSLAAVTKPVSTLRAGIDTHSARDAARPSVPQTSYSGAGPGGGMSAHATRPTQSGGSQKPSAPQSNVPSQDNRG